MSTQKNRIIAASTSCASLTKRLITSRRLIKGLLWPVGIFFFAIAMALIEGPLMRAEGVWGSIWFMLFGMAAVFGIATAMGNWISERCDLHALEIWALAIGSILILPAAALYLGNYLGNQWDVRFEAQVVIWAMGFLLGGAGWGAVTEQIAHMAESPAPTDRWKCLKSPKVQCMLRRTAANIGLNRLSQEIQRKADRLACRINKRGRREKWAAFWIAIATVLALFLMVLSWTILGFSRQEELLEEWMAEIFAVWYSVLAAGTALATLALFWHAIWRRLLRRRRSRG